MIQIYQQKILPILRFTCPINRTWSAVWDRGVCLSWYKWRIFRNGQCSVAPVVVIIICVRIVKGGHFGRPFVAEFAPPFLSPRRRRSNVSNRARLWFLFSLSFHCFSLRHFFSSTVLLATNRQRKKRTSLVAPDVEQVPQLYSPLASSIASQWYSAIAECFSRRRRAIRYASLGGEYNITATIGSNITVACNNITLTRSAYHFQFAPPFFVSTETAEQCFEPRSIALSFFVSFSLRYFLVLHFERSSLGYESSTKKRTSLRTSFFSLVTRSGIEPLLQPWKGRVLTAWPTSRVW